MWSSFIIHSFVTLRQPLAGEVCQDWQHWGQYLGISSILGQSLFHSFSYILLSVRAFPSSETCSHFHLSSDGFRGQCCGPGSIICSIVSPVFANQFDSLTVKGSAFHTGSKCILTGYSCLFERSPSSRNQGSEWGYVVVGHSSTNHYPAHRSSAATYLTHF
jgi:hypothetical protein